MKRKAPNTSLALVVAKKTKGTVFNELPIQLCDVSAFDILSPEECQSLFLRTQENLERIKRAYTELLSKNTFTRQTVLQFALDPAGRKKVDAKKWDAHILKDCIALCYRGRGGGVHTVYDRPTYRLIQLFFDNPKVGFWERRIPKSLSTESVLTALDVTTKFNIPRSTLQSWEEKGVPSACLAKLAFEENRFNRHSYRFADLRPFLEYYASRKSDLATLS